MKNIAIITARGGSKRIPGKNIKEFCGKPIISYSIEAALASGVFDEVMVSTDSDEIARIAIECGASVPFMRSPKNSDDYATTAEVLIEVLDEYENRNEIFEYACCIYPTAPFVTDVKIKKAFELLKNNNGTQVMPVTSYSHPPQRSFIMKEQQLYMNWPENRNKRTQDLEVFYHDTGQFYFFDVMKYRKAKGTILEGLIPMIVSEIEVHDIDSETDWKLAELKYKLMIQSVS